MSVWGFAQKVRPSLHSKCPSAGLAGLWPGLSFTYSTARGGLRTVAHSGVATEQLGYPGGSLGKGDLGRLEGRFKA